ncbi:glucan endo-1 3-beta-glucosidase 12 [Phtheirospermum japonicum]|uniref:Glucan endo-1 3-beta-glucosidase 12 n=1 Tax=Phtheirospermum japonicum TaxID=374723 RepID=A0A830CGG9_9LAMI|nr:glucan endo-1 3-beta-glucosidase 12 [Phtheirospermum japonicum]
MILAKITLAFIFIFRISQASPGAQASYWNEYCVADVQATDGMLQEALDWACAHGADCTMAQPDNACFEPNTLMHHASYAFNSYYQKNKHNNSASCYFKTAAVLNASDPSKKLQTHIYFEFGV